MRQRKREERRRKVLFVDASSVYRKARAQNTLEAEHVTAIAGWYKAYADVPGRARVMTLAEIAANDWNLNIPRYVAPEEEERSVSVPEALAALRAALEEAYAAEDRLKALLRREGLLS